MNRLIFAFAGLAATLCSVALDSGVDAQETVRQSYPPNAQTVPPPMPPQAATRTPAGSLDGGLQPTDQSGPFYNPTPRIASATTADYALERSNMVVKGGDTITVSIRFIAMDADIREQLYGKLDPARVTTQTQRIPDQQLSFIESAASDVSAQGRSAPEESATEESKRHVVISSPGAFTYAKITRSDVKDIFQQIEKSSATRLIASPRITTNENRAASMRMLAQKPFVVGIDQATVPPEENDASNAPTDIQVLNHGTEVSVTGTFEGDAIRLNASVQASKIVSMSTQRVFGLGPGKTVIQVPTHQVTCVSAVATLPQGESLLMDPYLEIESTSNPEQNESLLRSLPMRFTKESKPTKQYMMVVLTPTRNIDKLAQRSVPASAK